jgi:tRNA (adenine22-N1)-methyltransferase
LIKKTELPNRLDVLMNMLRPVDVFIDVGSDHGYASAYALENDLADRVIATDIHALPAERTAKYFEKQGLSDRTRVFCNDGLRSLQVHANDAVLIAGMGGYEIMHILEEALSEGAVEMGAEFLLQPQRSFRELREFMARKGIQIRDERIAEDKNKFYVGILAVYTGKVYQTDMISAVLGPVILEKRPLYFEPFIRDRWKTLKKEVLGQPELRPVLEYVEKVIQTL